MKMEFVQSVKKIVSVLRLEPVPGDRPFSLGEVLSIEIESCDLLISLWLPLVIEILSLIRSQNIIFPDLIFFLIFENP